MPLSSRSQILLERAAAVAGVQRALEDCRGQDKGRMGIARMGSVITKWLPAVSSFSALKQAISSTKDLKKASFYHMATLTSAH